MAAYLNIRAVFENETMNMCHNAQWTKQTSRFYNFKKLRVLYINTQVTQVGKSTVNPQAAS